MNASATFRASLYGLDKPLGPAPRVPAVPEAYQVQTTTTSTQQRRRTFVPVNYTEYKDQCVKVKEFAVEESTFDIDVEKGSEPPPPIPVSRWEQAGRMFTIFPYRDANWVIAIIYLLVGGLFALNAFLGLLPFLKPTLASPALPTVTTIANTIGGSLFLVGSALGVVATWNANRGTFDVADAKTVDGPAKTYKPALLGSDAWVWKVSKEELKDIFWTVPFQAALINMLGGLVISTARIAGLPGVLSPNDVFEEQVLVFTPLSIFGILFLFANLTVLMWLQDQWETPRYTSAAWQGTFWGAVGALNLSLAGIALIVGLEATGVWTTFVGSWAFFVASIIQWYDLMAFHPDAWAAR